MTTHRPPIESRRRPRGDVPNDLWTVDDVADYFKVTPRTIRGWREQDVTFPLPLDLPGRSLRWYRKDIVEWALSLRGLA